MYEFPQHLNLFIFFQLLTFRMSTYYFVIVGHNDNPIYEKEFSTVNKELRVSRVVFRISCPIEL